MEGEGRRGGCSAIGASAKENDVVVDGQMSEDEKMEKFYALIKSYRESRERIRIEREQEEGVENDEEERRKRKRTAKSGDRGEPTWIPAFKWEDFAESSQIKFRNSPVILPTSFDSMQGGGCVGRRDDPPPPEEEGGGLDLSLRL